MICKNCEQPTAQTVKTLVESIKKIGGVLAIFAETTINSALIKTFTQEAGVKLVPNQLYSDLIGAKVSEKDFYIKIVEVNISSIIKVLGENIRYFN
ncbi:MAG: zinc ABC transporter substrate-binding protein [Nostoc sp.]|uniref:metal ABC transporter solute-binding protein, Zn/Mn family n=1 Tax=Nostoc sp. TaxID=1180 RepID=UPI002FFB509E